MLIKKVRLLDREGLFDIRIVDGKFTEIAENDWYSVFKANLTIMEQYHIFEKFMQEPSYLRFSDRNIKQYSSKKQRIYFSLIRKRAVWRLMAFAYGRMMKNEIRDRLGLEK